MKFNYKPHLLNFKFEAGTSRGVLTEKKTWFIEVSENKEVSGIGECGPLSGLSMDDREDFEDYLFRLSARLKSIPIPVNGEECLELVAELIQPEYPSIRFGLETALLDYLNGGKKIIYDNDFVKRKRSIPINGLVWMGRPAFMLEQIEKKIGEGYSCLKLKIGALDFQLECDILKSIRRNFTEKELTLRVDANGAFLVKEAEEKLKVLAELGIHSIEQPIKQGQKLEMASLVKANILKIALDEELIGINSSSEKAELLDLIKPPFIILKPTLLGGFKSCQEWIELAADRNIGWWITSALESNIGLNAIAQFTAEYPLTIPQGLGTGQLYWNNIDSPLEIEKGFLKYGKQPWSSV